MADAEMDVWIVRRWLDPVLDAAGFEWNDSGVHHSDDGRLDKILYEADAEDFARRYPDTEIEESYGPDQWPPPCIDLWMTFDWPTGRLLVDLEGFDFIEELQQLGLGDLTLQATVLSGDLLVDSRLLATALAAVLRVAGPGVG